MFVYDTSTSQNCPGFPVACVTFIFLFGGPIVNRLSSKGKGKLFDEAYLQNS
jgi:hypothetical protein